MTGGSMRTVQKLTICMIAGIILLFLNPLTAQASEKTDAASNNLAFANVDNYANIRKNPDEVSEIVGKLYNNSAATVLETGDGWYKVKSGKVTGYINSDFLVTGKEAVKLSKKVGQTIATVTVKVLRVRSKASTTSNIITLISKGNTYEVTKDQGDWVKIKLNNGKSGYVAADYVKLSKKYEEAVPVKEAAITQLSSNTTASTKVLAVSAVSSKNADNSGGTTSLRDQIVSYALKFVGNPYRWGGTSLTNGADCSGFTQSILKKYGIKLPRTSREQAAGGKRVDLNDIRPGDLIFYRKNGTINHVALYIGNGKVISAKSPSEGIKISKYNYRTPYKAISYLG